MDHKWGRNVAEYGLGGTGATVASRVLGTAPQIVIVVTNAGRRGMPYYWILPNPGFVNSAYMGAGNYLPDRFPMGYNVEPDEDV